MTYLEQRRAFIEAGRPLKQKIKKPIAKMSAKRAARERQAKEALGGGDTELQKWMKARAAQMTGQCCRCGFQIEKQNFKFAICSIAHILPRSKFSSVATHPLNWLELGAACGCHGWMDRFASWDEIAQDRIWPLLLERFIMVEPSLSAEDRRNLPEVLSQEIKMPF
jgi:hypothetical protein